MSKFRFIAFLAWTIAAVPATAASPVDDPAVIEFRAREEAWANAIKAQDRAALEAFLAPDYSLTVALAGGLAKVNRASWLKNAVSTYKLHEFSFDEVAVRQYGNTAVVTSRYTQKATVDGGDRSGQFFLTDVWVRLKGKWKVSARYSSRLEARKP